MASHSSADEKIYWEQVYRLTGPDCEKALYAAHMDKYAYIADHLLERLAVLHGLDILSIGGGIDRPAVILAGQGNRVTSMDIAETAVARTAELARQKGVEDRMTFRVGDAEQISFDLPFDVVLCKRCLHHMDLRRVLPRIVGWLKPGGRFYAEEPLCLTRTVDFLHAHVPFLTRPYIEGEVLFNGADLDFFRSQFPNLRIEYFDFLTREAMAYVFHRLRLERLLWPLGRFDFLLLNRWLPVLRFLSSSVILEATKEECP